MKLQIQIEVRGFLLSLSQEEAVELRQLLEKATGGPAPVIVKEYISPWYPTPYPNYTQPYIWSGSSSDGSMKVTAGYTEL